MKKFLVVMLMVVLLVTGCSSGSGTSSNANIPEGMSAEVYNIGTEVVEITEDYLADKISADDFSSKIGDLASQLEELTKDSEDPFSPDSKVYTHTLSIQVYNGLNSDSNVESSLTELKSELNL